MTEFLTLPEVAARLRVSRRTVERLIRAGRLRAVKVGAQTRVKVREFEAYVATLDRAA